MICPRCSVADITEDTHQCPLCGFAPNGNVLVDQPVQDEVLDAVQQALVDKYLIQAVLRLGERSFVYLAEEVARERVVALKVIPVSNLVDHELAKRFERQAELAASLTHSHIVPIHDFGTTRSFLWYTMEHVRGQSLAELLRTSGPMDLDTCMRIAEQVASALDYAHRREVVHGNLKPSNIFVDEERWVRVSDFAVLDAFGRPAAPESGAPVLHMPEYLAPEQFYARSAGASADQYAFGVVLYQCLAGSVPFLGDSFEEVARLHAAEAPPRLSSVRADLPVYVMEAIQRSLSKVPAGRFPTILDFTSALSSGFGASSPRRSSAASTAVRPSAPPQSAVLVVDGGGRSITLKRMLLGTLLLVMIAVAVLVGIQPDWLAPMLERARSATDAVLPGGSGDRGDGLEWETLDPIGPAQSPRPTEQPTEPPGQAETSEPIQAGPAQTPGPAARAPGRLFVNSRPWGQLFIDGELIGNTPQPDLSLRPGTHVIRVERDGYVPFEREVRIVSGEVVRITDIVLEPLEE
jgi:serine/threonine-protein kinase